MIADLLNEDRTWKLLELQECFGEDLASLIINTPINSDMAEDQPELLHMKTGWTITAMAFDLNFQPTPYRFAWIRKLQLHPHEQFFWWRLTHMAIPTNSWLHQRNRSVGLNCPWGCEDIEDVEHRTVRCNNLKEILKKLIGWGCPMVTAQSYDELLSFSQFSEGHNRVWDNIYCSVVYQNWRGRNAKKHGREHDTPTTMATTVLETIIHAYRHPLPENWCTTRPCGLFRVTSWCPPPPEWLKINVDGSLYTYGAGGVGLVVRDHDGDLLKAAGYPILHWDGSQVEFRAVLEIQKHIEP